MKLLLAIKSVILLEDIDIGFFVLCFDLRGKKTEREGVFTLWFTAQMSTMSRDGRGAGNPIIGAITLLPPRGQNWESHPLTPV